MQYSLFSYKITHKGDPKYKGGILSLGKGTCKRRIRAVASRDDWVIAICSPNFLKQKGNFTDKCIQKHQNDCQQCLVYAMQVTNIKPLNRLNSEEKNILYSSNFYVFNNLLKMPKKFHKLIIKGQNHKRFPHKKSEDADIRLMSSFTRWLEKQPKEKSHLFGRNHTNSCIEV
jgi:hypothetical protein